MVYVSLSRRGIAFTGLLFTAAVLVPLLAGYLPRADARAAAPQTLDLASLPYAPVSRSGELRVCQRIPLGNHVESLGRVPERGALRVGLSERGYAQHPSIVRVFCGQREVATIESRGVDLWVDQRVDLGRYAGAECRVLFEAHTPLLLSACELTPVARTAGNVLLILIDTLRPDHLGSYGYDRNTSPNLDALAAEGVQFESMISQASWTRSAVASLLTSTYPTVHGAEGLLDPVRPGLKMLPEVFQAHGYATLGFMTNAWCLPAWGFGQGFNRYVDVYSGTVSGTKDREAADAVIDALNTLQGRPWFIYTHFIGPHAPYNPPAPFDTRFHSAQSSGSGLPARQARMIDQYDGAIAFTDAQLGRVLDALKRQNMYDDTLVVVLSDHGEAFGEHGDYGHASSLHDEQVHVPCIVKLPRGTAQQSRHAGITELIDVAPTLLDYAGLGIPAGFRGVSLRDAIEGRPAAHLPAYSRLFREDSNLYSARSESGKYVFDAATQRESWFNLDKDPLELAVRAEAPEGEAELAHYAAQATLSGSEGLHILVTGSLRDSRTIFGRLSGRGLREHSVYYPAGNEEIRRTADGLSFRITTSLGDTSPSELASWYDATAHVNNAHLVVGVDPAEPLSIEIELDGQPAPAGLIHWGAGRVPGPVPAHPLRLESLVAAPQMFYACRLPNMLAVYVWYVPSPGQVPRESVTREMVQGLQAMGYF